MLAIRHPGSQDRTSAICCADTASPASTTVPSARSATGAAARPDIRLATAEGTPQSNVTGYDRSASTSRSLTTSTHPPASSGANISNTETSKLNEVEASTRDSPPRPKAATAHQTRFTTLRCGTTTPFGVPVDPDVLITYAGCPGRSGPRRSPSPRSA